MALLENFGTMSLIEQITFLEEAREARTTAAIPDLMALYGEPGKDPVLEEILNSTLYALLSGQEEVVSGGLTHPNQRLQLLCIRRAGEDQMAGLKERLVAMLGNAGNMEVLAEVVRAVGNYEDPGLVQHLLPFLRHPDYAAMGWAMDALIRIGGEQVRDAFLDIVREQEATMAASGECDIRLAAAVESLRNFNDAVSISFLVGHIHNANPIFRRLVMSTLLSIGPDILDCLQEGLDKGDKDEKILITNLIGMLGNKRGADILVAILDGGSDLGSNFKFAIYEALGRINSIRSVVGLTDGLKETEELVLVAVVTGLDNLCHSGIVKVVLERIGRGDAQAGYLLQALITARARKLFAAVYHSEAHAGMLMDALAASANREAVESFRQELKKMPGERAAADARRLKASGGAVFTRRLVAADDSKAMLYFYKSVAAELGMELMAAADGQQALDLLQTADQVDLLITDLNMPNMTGIELVQELRKNLQWAALPVLMATTESEKTQQDFARQAGVNAFISKPFTKEEFKKKIGEIL